MEYQRPAIGTTTCTHPNSPDGLAVEGVWAEVVFGSRDRNCRGNGICKVMTLRGPEDTGRQQRICRRSVGRLTCPAPERLLFSFEETALCAHLVRHQFQDEVFKVPVAALLPGVLRRQLGLKGRWIARGVYPVRRVEGRLEFTVAVRRFQH